MSTIGAGVRVKGEVRADEDITVEGHVEGPVVCEGFAVTVARTAHITGDVLARDITVFGHSTGRLIATDVVDLRPESTVAGQIISKRFILHDGACFHGRAEPQHLEAALRVAKFNDGKQQEGPRPKAAGQS